MRRWPICRKCAHCALYQQYRTEDAYHAIVECSKGLISGSHFIERCSGFNRKRRRKGKPSWLR